MKNTVRFEVELPEANAAALQRLLTKLGFTDCRNLATSEDQAYQMVYASQKVLNGLNAGEWPESPSSSAAHPQPRSITA